MHHLLQYRLHYIITMAISVFVSIEEHSTVITEAKFLSRRLVTARRKCAAFPRHQGVHVQQKVIVVVVEISERWVYLQPKRIA